MPLVDVFERIGDALVLTGQKTPQGVPVSQGGDQLTTKAYVDSGDAVSPAEVSLPQGKVLIGGADGKAAAQSVSGAVALDVDGATSISCAMGKILIGDAEGKAVAQSVSGAVALGANGATTIPCAEGRLLVGDNSGVAVAQAMSGHAQLAASGAVTIQPSVITPAMLQFVLGGADGTPVVLDHADSSPKEILAAHAALDRIVMFRAVATEDAAGGPDLDIGITGATTSIVEDYKSGAWVVGDTITKLFLLPAGAAAIATIAEQGTAGAFAVTTESVNIPRVRRQHIAGQNEGSNPDITISGMSVGDELISFEVWDPGVLLSLLPSLNQRANSDFTVAAGKLTVTDNAANNTGNTYLVTWLQKV